MTRIATLLCALVMAGCVKSKDTRATDDALLAPSRTGAGGEAGESGVGATARETADAALPAPVQRWVELTKSLGHDIRRVGTSCAQVAKVVSAFVSKQGREYGDLQREVERWEKRTLRKEVDRFYRRAFPDLNARIDAGIRCKDDPAARAAYDAFFRVAGLDTR